MKISSVFIDPGFVYEAALSKMAGHSALRMANADVLPFDFRILFREIKSYTAELQTLMANMRESTSINNEIIKKKYWIIAGDTSRPFAPDAIKQSVPFIDFSPLDNAVAGLGKAADHAYELSKILYRIQN